MSDSARPKFTIEETETPGTAGQPPNVTETNTPLTNEPPVPAQPKEIVPTAQEFHVTNPTGEHPLRKLLFLIPAIILIVTIAVAAYLTNKEPVVREPVSTTVAPFPSLPPATPAPTLPPKPKTFTHGSLRYSFSYPSELNIVDCNSSVYLLTENEFEDLKLSENVCENVANLIIPIEVNTSKDEILPADNASEIDIAGQKGFRSVAQSDLNDNKTKTTDVIFSFENIFYEIIVNDTDYEHAFETIISTFKVRAEDPTKDWTVFTNSKYEYRLKYPPPWTLITEEVKEEEIGPRLEIRKDKDEEELHTLTIETQLGIKDVSLTASQTISSTKNLSGWKGRPVAEFRSVGGGNAELIQGQLNGNWSVFVVVWYKDILVQMTWNDSLNKDDQETFENILSTFEFTR